MQKQIEKQQIDDELADTLITVSVISKRLAQKIRLLSSKEQKKEGGTPYEQDE